MRNFLSTLFFGKDPLLNGLFLITILSLAALGCTNLAKNENSSSTSNSTLEGDSDMPDDRLLKATVKLTTAEFANAISTEDFAKLHKNASTEFQNQYSVEETKNIFADAIKNKRALLPMLAKLVSMDPEFTEPPSIRREQNRPILVVKGRYDTKPRPLEFEYEYVKQFGSYKLLKLILK